MVERAPFEEAGGNSRFTAGAIRCVYDGLDDLRALMPDLSDEEIARTEFGTYGEEQFFDDMGRVTQYRCDPDLTELLVRRSRETLRWMRTKGIPLPAHVGPPGLRDRRPFQILGRRHDRKPSAAVRV